VDECEFIKIYLKNNHDVQEIINIVTTFRIALFDSNPEKFEQWYNKKQQSIFIFIETY